MMLLVRYAKLDCKSVFFISTLTHVSTKGLRNALNFLSYAKHLQHFFLIILSNNKFYLPSATDVVFHSKHFLYSPFLCSIVVDNRALQCIPDLNKNLRRAL